eukprot:482163-Amphidinium_carterae.1
MTTPLSLVLLSWCTCTCICEWGWSWPFSVDNTEDADLNVHIERIKMMYLPQRTGEAGDEAVEGGDRTEDSLGALLS